MLLQNSANNQLGLQHFIFSSAQQQQHSSAACRPHEEVPVSCCTRFCPVCCCSATAQTASSDCSTSSSAEHNSSSTGVQHADSMRKFQSAAAPDSVLYAAALQQRKQPARTAALHLQQSTTACTAQDSVASSLRIFIHCAMVFIHYAMLWTCCDFVILAHIC